MTLSIVLAVALALDASPTPSPSPVPTPMPHFELHGMTSNVFVDQSTSGPGQTPPEGPPFLAGNPAAPMTPFDWFVTTPLLPGVAGQIQYSATGTWHWKNLSADVTVLLSGIQGDSNNGLYWGEPLVGRIDPHEGNDWINYHLAYPTSAATAGTSTYLGELPYNATLRSNDGSFKLSTNYVQTSQYDPFVFTQPVTPSWTPTMNFQTFETLGPGLSDLDSWKHFATALPLRGADATAKIGSASVEATVGLLPSPLVTLAHLAGANVVFDEGDRGRFSFDVMHVQTSGDSQIIPTFFGSNPTVYGGPQGKLATSTVGNERQTIVGGRAFFHPRKGYDATLDLGRAWFHADMVAQPGSEQPGDYQHYALLRHFNATDDAGIEFYRMEPRYATIMLPYGTFENVWGIAWAYPGPWLKGTYQLASDAFGGSNRRGFRAHTDFKRGPWSAAAAYYEYRQIDPSTWDNLTHSGFVEVDYLVLDPGDLSYGHTRGLNAFLSYAAKHDTFSFDFSNDSQHRDYSPGHAIDGVDVRYPQMVLADQHTFSSKFIANAGYERYHAAGLWGTTPVNGTFAAAFLGGQWDFGRAGQLFVQVRRYGACGFPSIPGGPPPTLNGTQIIVDHHYVF